MANNLQKEIGRIIANKHSFYQLLTQRIKKDHPKPINLEEYD